MSHTNTFTIGSVVRVPRECASIQLYPQTPPKNLKHKYGRAVVATIDDKDRTICVFWENSSTPRPIIDWDTMEKKQDSSRKYHFLSKHFLVCPLFDTKEQDDDDEKEFTVSVQQALPLLDFEIELMNASSNMNCTSSAKEWKEKGDELLRLGDATAAIPYYEVALAMTSKLQVGGSALIQRKGRVVVVDIDCVNDDDDEDTTTTIDVTFVNEDGEEEEVVVKETQLLLCLTPSYHSNSNDGTDESFLQQKILLNLSRCLLHLAEIDFGDTVQNRPYEYRKATVLACSMVLTVSSFQIREEEEVGTITTSTTDQTAKLKETALLLRSKAQSGRSKWKHAIADIQHILKQNPCHVEAKRILQQIQHQRTKQKKTDKKLSKAICKLVNQAATASTNNDDDSSSAVSDPLSESMTTEGQHNKSTKLPNEPPEKTSFLTQFLLPCIVALAAFYILQNYRF